MGAPSRTRAIVLRRTNYGEADRILKLITPLGQVSVMARGVRRERSRLAGGIELFAVSDMTFQSGKGKLAVLTSARLEKFFANILSDYDRLEFGYLATKLVMRASEDIDDSAWFDTLLAVYEGLDDDAIDRRLVEAWFYLRYASATGYELSLERDVLGAVLDAGETYSYDISERGLRPNERGEITADHIKFLRLVAVKPLRVVAQIGGVDDILSDCWHLTRQAAAI